MRNTITQTIQENSGLLQETVAIFTRDIGQLRQELVRDIGQLRQELDGVVENFKSELASTQRILASMEMSDTEL
jgi:hypothetical protein